MVHSIFVQKVLSNSVAVWKKRKTLLVRVFVHEDTEMTSVFVDSSFLGWSVKISFKICLRIP